MVDAFTAAEISVDLAASGIAVALGLYMLPRLRGSRLWFPLTLMFVCVACFGAADAASHYVASAGDLELGRQFQKSAHVTIGLSVAGLAQFLLLFPRPLPWGWSGHVAAAVYAVALLYGLLAPTRFVIEDVMIDQGRLRVVAGPLYTPLIVLLTASLMAAATWPGYLALRGRSPQEKRDGLALVGLTLGPLAVAVGLFASEHSVTLPLDPISIGFILWVGLVSLYVYRRRASIPIPPTLRAVMNSSTEAILIVGPEGQLISGNAACKDVLGLDPRTLTNRPLREALAVAFPGPDQASFVHTAVMGVLRGRAVAPAESLRGVGPRKRTCRLLAVPVVERASWGSGTSVIVTFSDETDRASLEDARKRTNELLDLVIRVLGHDLKAPIAVIQGYVELLQARLGPTARAEDLAHARRDLDKMSEALVAMLVLLANARAVSRLAVSGEHPMPTDDVDLSRVTRQETRLLQPKAVSKELRLEVQVEEGIRVRAARGFESVVRNLVDNAVKYTPPGGEVRVDLRRDHNGATLTVTDSGPGVPPEKRPLLFRKFERLGAESSGTEGQGLGLSIVASLVTLSGGTVEVDDRADQRPGAVFRVQMPTAAQGPAAATSSSQAGS